MIHNRKDIIFTTSSRSSTLKNLFLFYLSNFQEKFSLYKMILNVKERFVSPQLKSFDQSTLLKNTFCSIRLQVVIPLPLLLLLLLWIKPTIGVPVGGLWE